MSFMIFKQRSTKDIQIRHKIEMKDPSEIVNLTKTIFEHVYLDILIIKNIT